MFYLCSRVVGVVSPLESLLERTVAGLGYGLADFEYINNGRMLRVFIEKTHELVPERAGVTLADCESVSRQLQRVFEVEGIEYDRLEVSSPGLDRRLKKAADFARFAGHEAQVRLRHPVNGRRNFVGTVRAVEGDRIEFDYDSGRLAFDLADLDRARLVPKP
ncbi:MAG: ribosome maturation factor RimP [Betaproteobacteria bacterium]|nr:MAG: ribosome maturation factor RimP [Betaproteobacteria bacterium]TMH91982.1 MAG: ribosome maturation factor RimP [Betaproteobacteria bacterium]